MTEKKYEKKQQETKRCCTSLKEYEPVVFLVYSDIYKRKVPTEGNVLYVDEQLKTVCVSWLEGYKDRKEDVPFSDMLAVYNPKGILMHFENIFGQSDVLIPQ